MYSIHFYFMPGAIPFEACGYLDQTAAVQAFADSNWFVDEGGNPIFINDTLKTTAVIKIAERN